MNDLEPAAFFSFRNLPFWALLVLAACVIAMIAWL